MIKLYKRIEDGWLYWEAWESAVSAVTLHWGVLGNAGQTTLVKVPAGGTPDDVIMDEALRPRAQGYKELELADHSQIVVQYNTEDAWGGSDDLEKRYRVEEVLNGCLGWTGNGHCDGGDIGSGTINSYSFVVDANLAKATIVEALQSKRAAQRR